MIKTLRRKFIAITMASVVLVLFGLIGTMDVLNYYKTITNIYSEMDLLKLNGGDMFDFKNKKAFLPENEEMRPGGEAPFALRYFTVTVNDAGERIPAEGKINFYVGFGQPDELTEKLTGKKAFNFSI